MRAIRRMSSFQTKLRKAGVLQVKKLPSHVTSMRLLFDIRLRCSFIKLFVQLAVTASSWHGHKLWTILCMNDQLVPQQLAYMTTALITCRLHTM